MDDLSRRREVRDATWLALVPVGMGLLLGILLFPRRAIPETVPLPVADVRALARVEDDDHALAEKARHDPLPAAVRALGTATRAFHTLEARDADARELYDARRAVDQALVEALPVGTGPLLELRAVQLEAFLVEVRRFEASGQQSPELAALAGAFVRSMSSEGWCEGHTLAPDEAALRTMFKHMWNGFLAPDLQRQLAPTLDEERVLYAFYLSHPHPTRAMREAIVSARRVAPDEKACAALDDAERASTESWRLEHIGRLAALDSSYPADYARGVAHFRRGDYGASAASFRLWLRDHPEGPLALRAQNYLRAAAVERLE